MAMLKTLDRSTPAAEPQLSFRRGQAKIIWRHPVAIFSLALILASTADHLLGSWLGFSQPSRGFIGAYRRVGPNTGPQIFCAGSSLTVAALNWPEVSQATGMGIETWSVAGSSPDIWELWQQHSPRSTTTIIGVSVYDLNEFHVAPERADVVPLQQTINDLWASHADSGLSQRILAQYVLRYVQLVLPTAGASDKFLTGIRSKIAALTGHAESLAKYEGAVVEPAPPALAAGDTNSSVSDWSTARLLRRIAVLRAENRGRNEFFRGPKHLAFERMLLRARLRGPVIVVVLPVARQYTQEMLDDHSAQMFEKALQEAMALVPNETLIRLDRLPELSNPDYFLDLVHMNSRGRQVATDAFLSALNKPSR